MERGILTCTGLLRVYPADRETVLIGWTHCRRADLQEDRLANQLPSSELSEKQCITTELFAAAQNDRTDFIMSSTAQLCLLTALLCLPIGCLGGLAQCSDQINMGPGPPEEGIK